MKTALLDLDGTLVDSNYQHALAWYRAFHQAGVVLPGGVTQSRPRGGGSGEPRTFPRRSRRCFAAAVECEPLPGAFELLSELKRRGHTIVLASSANARDLGHFLDKLGARDVADGWTTADDVAASKPAPDIIHAALEKAGVKAKDAVMIGDSRWDVEAAKRARVPTTGVLTGGWAAEELLDAGAVAVLESLEELRDRLDETPLG